MNVSLFSRAAMKSLHLPFAVFIICFTLCVATSCQSNKIVTLIVGSSTPSVRHSWVTHECLTEDTGICTYRFNERTLEVIPVQGLEAYNPTFMAVSSDAQRVYVVNEGNAATSGVSAYELDASNGVLSFLNQSDRVGAGPCFIALSKDQQYVVTANYEAGSLSVFSVDSLTHGVGPLKGNMVFMGSGPVPDRQEASHLHCIAFEPSGKYFFATDLGADKIYTFATLGASQDGTLSLIHVTDLPKGFGPRHVVFNKKGSYAYLIGELSGQVMVLSHHDGLLTPLQEVVADTCDAMGSAHIALSPCGRFLYTSTRLKGDGIQTFKVNRKDGTLQRLSHTPTGKHPRMFALTPSGSYLLVACRDQNAIEIYKRNPRTGCIIGKVDSIIVQKPMYIDAL